MTVASKVLSRIVLLCLSLAWTAAGFAIDTELDRARTMVRDGQHHAAIALLEKLSSSPRNPRQDEALELLGVAREKSGQLALAKLTYRQFLQRFPDSPALPRVEQRLSTLVTAALPAKQTNARKRRRRSFRERLVSVYFSQYARHDQRRIDVSRDGLGSTSVAIDVTRVDTGLDVTARHSWRYAKTAVRTSAGHSYKLGEAGYGTTRLKNLYVDAEGTASPWRARLGRQSRHRGGIYGRFDGAVLGYRPTNRIGVELTGGRRVLSSAESADEAPTFAGLSVNLDIAEHMEAEVHVVEESNAEGRLHRIVGFETRLMDSVSSAFAQFDYDLEFARIDNARLHLQRRGFGDAIYHGSAEVHRISMLDLERLALEDPLFDPLLLDPEEIYYYATRDAALTTNISAGVRGDAVGGFRYDISASSTQSPGSEGDVRTHAMTFQLTAANVFGPAGSAGTTFTVGERDDEQRAAFQLYASHNFGNWYVRPRLRLDYVRDSGISKFERFTLTPLLRLDYRGRRARYELQCGASFGDSTSADRTSRELGYFVTLGYRLTL